KAVGGALAARIVAVIGEQRSRRRAGVSLVEKRAANEVVGVAHPTVLRICLHEGAQRADRGVIVTRFPLVEALTVGVLAGVGGGRGRRLVTGSRGRRGFGGLRRRRRARARLGRRGIFHRSRRRRGRRRRGGGFRGRHALLERLDPLVLVAFHLADAAFEAVEPVAIVLALAKQVGHLPLERVEPLVEGHHRRLGRGGIVGIARGVGRAALGVDPALKLVDLALEALDALLGRRRLALGERARGRKD